MRQIPAAEANLRPIIIKILLYLIINFNDEAAADFADEEGSECESDFDS